MKTLIIAEKPDMGRNIAAAIEPKSKNMRSYLEGETYIITWAIGHLVSLAEPDAYEDRFKKWNITHLPIIPDQFKLIANQRTADQLKTIKELASRSDRIVNACDAGREGQYIFSLIQRYLQLQQPVQRLWISDLTAETIQRGFQELKPEQDYHNLTLAASARSEADWLIGMNGTRAFTTKHKELLSVGRVQTPVLALIYDREQTISKFDSLTFYDVEAQFTQNSTEYKGLWQGERLTDKERAERIAAKVKGKPASVDSYEVKDVKEYPYRLYDLTLLQREANSKLGFSAKKTLDIAQALYEKHKVITYPRTNSNYVTEQNIPEMHKALQSLSQSTYKQWVDKANRSLVHTGNKAICNPTKVEDHHAILPTVRKATSLSADEAKVYDLVVRRFLSQFYPPALYKAHTIMTLVESEYFKTNIKQLLSLGWKEIYAEQQSEQQSKKKKSTNEAEDAEEIVELDHSFELEAEAAVLCDDAVVKEKSTKPPKSFTEGTLLKAMESAGKQIEDDEMREAMKDSGLGTPATRASTIERLKNVGYISMQGKRILITSKGKTAIELIRGAGVELLASPEMTGMWEKRLNDISRGQASNTQFMENVKKFATMIVDKVRVQQAVARSVFEVAAQPTKATKTKSSTSSQSAKSTSTTAAKQTSAKTAKAASSTGNEAKSTSSATATASTIEWVAACPRASCGGKLFMGKKGYGCSHYKSGCGFVIWKDSFGRSLTVLQVRQLVEKGRTNKLKLVTPGGDEIQGNIVLVNTDTGELSIDM